jgi:hypothetical protein
MLYSSYLFTFLLAPIFLLRTLPYRCGLKRNHTIERYSWEHIVKNPLIFGFVEYFCQKEMATIREGGQKRFGASILAVARKRKEGC